MPLSAEPERGVREVPPEQAVEVPAEEQRDHLALAAPPPAGILERQARSDRHRQPEPLPRPGVLAGEEDRVARREVADGIRRTARREAPLPPVPDARAGREEDAEPSRARGRAPVDVLVIGEEAL